MTDKEIINILKSRFGIEMLNDMQVEMSRTNSPATLLLAPTGSGKTIAFAIPVAKRLKPSNDSIQSIIIAPSRELVLQIYDVVRVLCAGKKTVAFYGGHSMIDETKSLSVIPDVIVATPGRLLDHINRGNIDISRTDSLVLDEYDKSLELGFHDEMRRIARHFKGLKQIIMTSATRLDEMPQFLPVRHLKTIDYSHTDKDLKQRLQLVRVGSPVRDKLQTLSDLLHSLPNKKTIVFVNHRESVERVYLNLKSQKLPVGMYHGGLEQLEREIAIELLNNGSTPILISTDLGARGLDIDAVGAVIHYHMPPTEQNWTHRNGRTARVDAEGTAYIITAEGENIPDFVEWQRDYAPSGKNPSTIISNISTLYFNLGKKEKISRGDIVGFLINKGGLTSQQIGRITVKDHCALAAIPSDNAYNVLKAIASHKIKNQRARITLIDR